LSPAATPSARIATTSLARDKGHRAELPDNDGDLRRLAEPGSVWSVLGSIDGVRETLATVIDSGDSVARSAAVGVLNLLGARGMSEFRDLVPLTADG
jgi:hypothetical protein